ncbi:MAG TPA: toll/interleukin-1 receptor domain-containing protein [Pyrinomonadaceae bacterium]|jgi:hypothetical protein|nr:toll/interleukin-1 receptor domain-containing protein [Pyrinomonadaceae bacterium]
MRGKKEKSVNSLAKDFFGFGRSHTPITIVLPSFEKERISNLVCANYPRYNYEVSPDDVISSLRIYCLLSQSYPNRVQMNFDREFTLRPEHHTVLIGGPPTNTFVEDATRNCPIHFSPDGPGRHLIGPDKKYKVGFSDGSLQSIVEDYCLISKRTYGTKSEFVIAGLRAYGQVQAYNFLGDANFYRQAGGVAKVADFQIVVKVSVKGPVATDWEIAKALVVGEDSMPRYDFDAFLCHSSHDAASVQEITARLRERGISVWLDAEQILVGDSVVAKIQDGLRRSKYLVTCLSVHLDQSNWCRAEYAPILHREFSGNNTRVIPVGVADYAEDDIPILLSDKRRVDAMTPQGFEELVKRLKM